jgi:hypothetical protein
MRDAAPRYSISIGKTLSTMQASVSAKELFSFSLGWTFDVSYSVRFSNRLLGIVFENMNLDVDIGRFHT